MFRGFIAVLLIRILYTIIHNMSRKIHNDTQIFYAKEDESIHLLPDDTVDSGLRTEGSRVICFWMPQQLSPLLLACHSG